MNFLIIGVGNIGLRHIQGLSKINNSKFFLYDKNNNYKVRFKIEFDKLKKNNQINYFSNMDEIENKKLIYKLIILSITSEKRVAMLRRLRKIFPETKILIEKPICQSILELNRLKNIKENTYVNYPRRYYPWFSKIKKEFLKNYKKNKLNLKIRYINLGLATNTCHYIDLFNFLTNLNPNKVILKNEKWFESKRKGFFDLNGDVEIDFGKNNKLIINSLTSKDDKKIFLSIEGILDDSKFIINYNNNTCIFSNQKKIHGKTLLQSECSDKMFKNIQAKNNLITNLDTAINSYELFLKELIKSWNKSFSQNKRKIQFT